MSESRGSSVGGKERSKPYSFNVLSPHVMVQDCIFMFLHRWKPQCETPAVHGKRSLCSWLMP